MGDTIEVIDRLSSGFRESRVYGRRPAAGFADLLLGIDTMDGGRRLVARWDNYYGDWEPVSHPPWVLPAFLAGAPIGGIIDCLIECNPEDGGLAEAAVRVAPYLGECDRSARHGR